VLLHVRNLLAHNYEVRLTAAALAATLALSNTPAALAQQSNQTLLPDLPWSTLSAIAQTAQIYQTPLNVLSDFTMSAANAFAPLKPGANLLNIASKALPATATALRIVSSTTTLQSGITQIPNTSNATNTTNKPS
jgi:hypothetical protein